MDDERELEIRRILKARRGETTEQAAVITIDRCDSLERERKELAELLGCKEHELKWGVQRQIDVMLFRKKEIDRLQEEIDRLKVDHRRDMVRAALSGTCSHGMQTERMAKDAVEAADLALKLLEGKSTP